MSKLLTSENKERPPQENPTVLFGWKEIANFLHMGVRTAQRYEQVDGLPVRRPVGNSKGGAVIATIAELQAWVAARPLAHKFELANMGRNSSAWAGLQEGMAKMRSLRDEMRLLRSELRATVEELHSNIHEVGRESRTTSRGKTKVN